MTSVPLCRRSRTVHVTALPQLIVRFLTGPPTATSLALAGLTGAVLLLASDLVVQHLLPVEGLPVGAVTATLGAPWLLVLMFRQSKPVHRSHA